MRPFPIGLSFHSAGSFKVTKYHGSAKDATLSAVKRGEYEVGRYDLLCCNMMSSNTMGAD